MTNKRNDVAVVDLSSWGVVMVMHNTDASGLTVSLRAQLRDQLVCYGDRIRVAQRGRSGYTYVIVTHVDVENLQESEFKVRYEDLQEEVNKI